MYSVNLRLFFNKNSFNFKVQLEDDNIFTDLTKEADTLAGLVIEIAGKIPQKNEKINTKNFTFIVEAADKRRIKRIKLIQNKNNETKTN